jgi:hypothetical protein
MPVTTRSHAPPVSMLSARPVDRHRRVPPLAPHTACAAAQDGGRGRSDASARRWQGILPIAPRASCLCIVRVRKSRSTHCWGADSCSCTEAMRVIIVAPPPNHATGIAERLVSGHRCVTRHWTEAGFHPPAALHFAFASVTKLRFLKLPKRANISAPWWLSRSCWKVATIPKLDPACSNRLTCF